MRGDWLDRLRLSNAGRIEQEGVVADNSASRPIDFDNQVEKGLVDRLGRGYPQIRLAVRALLNGDARPPHDSWIGHVVIAIDGLIGDPRRERIQFVLLRRR